MRNLKSIIVFIVAAVLAASCSGRVDDQALPVLEVSDGQIDLATETHAVFTVTYNGEDVTGESVISCTSSGLKLETDVFYPEAIGTEVFVAEYDGKQSQPVSVEVINSSPQVESVFRRHVFVAEFTGAWCINCPGGYDNMMLQLSKPSMAEYKDRIHLAAFHSDVDGTDTLAIEATQDVFRLFKGLAYPSFAVDLRDSGLLTSDGIGSFIPALQSSFNDHKPHCGVAVSSKVTPYQIPETLFAEVTVKVTSELTDSYRLVLMVVQDKIKGWQKTPVYSEGTSDYVHKHVVRKVVTTYGDTFTGYKITDNGIIPAGEEVTKDWLIEIDDRWDLENTEIYALILDSEGYVNNMNLCRIDGGDSGYDIK